ncbi:MAG: hypothetical protein ABSG41_14850 [Bryobacteraceae bacterium]
MIANPDYNPCPSRLLGRAMLDAWLCGDQSRLSQKLEDVRSFRIHSAGIAEQDRLEVLKTMAYQMALSSDLFAPRSSDPRLGSWIDLLDHLATSDGDTV